MLCRAHLARSQICFASFGKTSPSLGPCVIPSKNPFQNPTRTLLFSKMPDEITFVVERDPESGWFCASWDAPEGGGITTQARALKGSRSD